MFLPFFSLFFILFHSSSEQHKIFARAHHPQYIHIYGYIILQSIKFLLLEYVDDDDDVLCKSRVIMRNI